MKKKILLCLSTILLLSGCGNQEKGYVLTCSQTDQDSGMYFEYKMNYNETWLKIQKTTATMSLDVSKLSEDELNEMVDEFEGECEEAGDEAESCIVKKENGKLILTLVGDIGKFDENPVVTSDSTVEEAKLYFESEGLTCKRNN